MHLLKNTNDVFLDRVLNKFKENEFEKIERLIEIYKFYQEMVKTVEKKYTNEEKINILKEFQPNLVFFSSKNLEIGMTKNSRLRGRYHWITT